MSKRKDLKPGMRVALAPNLDLWMRGMRYADVQKVGRVWIHIEENGIRARVLPQFLTPVESIGAGGGLTFSVGCVGGGGGRLEDARVPTSTKSPDSACLPRTKIPASKNSRAKHLANAFQSVFELFTAQELDDAEQVLMNYLYVAEDSAHAQTLELALDLVALERKKLTTKKEE